MRVKIKERVRNLHYLPMPSSRSLLQDTETLNAVVSGPSRALIVLYGLMCCAKHISYLTYIEVFDEFHAQFFIKFHV